MANVFLAARESAALTQQEVADILGITRAAISRWELGVNSPKIKDAAKIAKAYGLTREQVEQAIIKSKRKEAATTNAP